MSRLGWWFAAAIVSAAGAGGATGLAFCRVLGGGDEVDQAEADAAVEAEFVRDYRLTSQQTLTLQAIRRALRRDEAQIYARYFNELPTKVKRALSDVRSRSSARIKFMLDADQRSRYERAIEQHADPDGGELPSRNDKR